ncbi:MAG: hypothetical protein R6X02_00690 [Enhygromyxa sp.]
MSLGAVILMQDEPRSDNFAVLEDELLNAVTEIRVEQHLDKQASFAIRFQEDFEDTRSVENIQRLFAQARGMAVLVPTGEVTEMNPDGLVCLIRGQVENVEFDVNTGGSGSWFEVRGQDTRTLINRKSATYQFDGASHEFLAEVVEACTTEKPDIGEQITNYIGGTYRCRGSRLDAVYELARKSAFHFWLTYEVVLSESYYQVKTTGHVKSSPDRNDSEQEGKLDDLKDLGLVLGDAAAKLKILGEDGECETVINFSSKVDNEVYNVVISHGQNLDDGSEETNEESSLAPELNDGESPATVGYSEGPMLEWGDEEERALQVTTVGDVNIARWQAYAAATAASWYVRGEALTTVHMLKQLLMPHEVVEVVGGGCGIAGKYQVSDVTHIINPAAHWMQLSLRSNSRSLEEKKVL